MLNLFKIDELPVIGEKEIVYELPNGDRFIWQDDSTSYLKLDMMPE